MDALRKLQEVTNASATGITDYLAAVSVGIVDGVPLLVWTTAKIPPQVDFNVVMTGSGKIVEVQGTGGKAPSPAQNSCPFWTWRKRASRNSLPFSASSLRKTLRQNLEGVRWSRVSVCW